MDFKCRRRQFPGAFGRQEGETVGVRGQGYGGLHGGWAAEVRSELRYVEQLEEIMGRQWDLEDLSGGLSCPFSVLERG